MRRESGDLGPSRDEDEVDEDGARGHEEQRGVEQRRRLTLRRGGRSVGEVSVTWVLVMLSGVSE